MTYRLFKVLLRVAYRIFFRLEVIGQQHIPHTGSVLLCANHTSNLDPACIAVMISRQVRFMAKEELFRVPLLGALIKTLGAFPVKRGGVTKQSIRNTITLLQNGEVVGIFPEGSRTNKSGVAKKGAATFAFRSGASVVPAAIIGDYRLFRKMKIVYGEPIDLTKFQDLPTSEGLEQATNKIMSKIYEMLRTGHPSRSH